MARRKNLLDEHVPDEKDENKLESEKGHEWSMQYHALLRIPGSPSSDPESAPRPPLIIGSLDPSSLYTEKSSIALQTKFLKQHDHMSFVELHFTFFYPGPIRLDREEAGYQVTWPNMPECRKLVQQGIAMTCEPINTMEEERKSQVLEEFNLPKDFATGDLYRLEMVHPRQPNHCAYNLFTFKKYDEAIDDQITATAEFLYSSVEPIVVLVCGLFVKEWVNDILECWSHEITADWQLMWLEHCGRRNRVFEGKNVLRGGSTRAKHTVWPRPNFLSFREAQIMIGVALRQDEEVMKNVGTIFEQAEIRVIEVPGGRANDGTIVEFGAFLTKRWGFNHLYKDGAMIELILHPSSKVTSSIIVGRIVKSPPMALVDQVAIRFSRPWDKDKLVWKPLCPDEVDLPIANLNDYKSIYDGQEAISSLTPHEIQIRPKLVLEQYRRLYKALAFADSRPWRETLVNQITGNNLWSMPKFDMFNYRSFDVSNKEEWERKVTDHFEMLRGDQRQVIPMLRNMAMTFGMITGCAGSGKTTIVLQVAKLLLTTLSEKKERNLGMFVYPDNQTADSACEATFQAVSKARKELGQPEPRIARLYSQSAEKQVLFNKSAATRPRHKNKAPYNFYELDLDEDDLGVVAYYIHRMNDDRLKRRFPYISDQRVKLIEFALGTHMGRLIDIMGKGDPLYDPMKTYVLPLREYFYRYISGHYFTQQDKDSFGELRARCRKDALYGLDAVFTTDSQMLVSAYYTPLRSRRIYAFFDEASKQTFHAFFAIQSVFIDPPIYCSVMIGDHHQGDVVFKTEVKINCLAPWGQRSLLQWGSSIGLPCVYLSQQNRTVAEISDLWATILYSKNGRVLKAHPAVNEHPEAKKALEVAQKVFGKQSRLILVNTPGTVTERLRTGTSKYNERQLFGTKIIVNKLKEAGVPGSKISAFTPYTAQNQLALHVFDPLKRGHEEGQVIDVKTFMQSQGSQNDYVVATLAASNTTTFLEKAKFLVPGLTRARYMLIIITDLKGMQASQNYRDSILEETIDYCLKKDLEYELQVTGSTPDFNKMMPSAGIGEAIAQTAFGNKTAKHCYKCGDAGHFAKNCDKPKSKNCYACGKEGHSWQKCPTDLYCRKCKVTGHTNKDCPSVKRTKQCDNCSSEYHSVRDCPKKLTEMVED